MLAYCEVYYGEENRPASLLEFEGAMDCVIEFHSFSKSFNMTGWRCGFCVGAPALIKGLMTVKSNVDSGCFNAIQLAMARALDDERCDTFLAENRAHYEKRLNRICAALTDMGVTYYRPGASIFVWCDLPNGERDSVRLVRPAAGHHRPGGQPRRGLRPVRRGLLPRQPEHA